MGEDAKHDSLLDCDSSQEVPGKVLCRVLWLRLCVGGFLGGVSPCHLSSLSDSGRQRCQVRRESCVRFCWCAVSHTHACETHKMLDYARREPINNCLLLNFLFSCIIWLCDLKNSRYRICMWGTLKEGPVFNYKNDTFIFYLYFLNHQQLWEIIRASSKALSTITRFFVSAEKNMLFNRKPFLYHYVTTVLCKKLLWSTDENCSHSKKMWKQHTAVVYCFSFPSLSQWP